MSLLQHRAWHAERLRQRGARRAYWREIGWLWLQLWVGLVAAAAALALSPPSLRAKGAPVLGPLGAGSFHMEAR